MKGKKEWSREEIDLLLHLANNRHTNCINWKEMAQNFDERSQAEVRGKYVYLYPGLSKGRFTIEEDLRLQIGIKIFG